MATLVACSGDDDGTAGARDTTTTAELPAEHRGPGFYDVPDTVPGEEPGDLIRYEQIEPSAVTGTVWRVLHRSESVGGDPIAVSGLVVVPDGSLPAGGRPVLSWAHGTTGLADECAPSRQPDAGSVAALAAPFLERGFVVTASDYEGLGTPGLHPYIVGVSEGRGVLDIVRAARQLPGSGAGDKVVVWGHSQGGHAALFAGEIARTWAPDLDLLGTVAGAPATELPLIAAALRDSPFRPYLAMAAAGINAAHPEAELDLVLSDEAIARLDVMEQGCTGAIFEAFADVSYDDLVAADFNEVEPWRTLVEANNPGTVRQDAPILVIHGEADEQIPVVASQLLVDRLCGLGQVVERRVYPGADHAGVIGPSMPDLLAWVDDRLAGEAAPSSCP